MKLTIDQEDADLLAGALRTSLTWTLDALGSSISPPASREHVKGNLAYRARIRRLLIDLDHDGDADDSYRFGHIIDYAKRQKQPGIVRLLEASR